MQTAALSSGILLRLRSAFSSPPPCHQGPDAAHLHEAP